MSADEFQQLWKKYDARLEHSLQLNLRLLREVQSQKARSAVRGLTAGRILGIGIGLGYEVLLVLAGWLVHGQPVMVLSVGAIVLVTAVAIAAYLRELILIGRISYADNIVDTQNKLAGIQSSIMRSLRISWLQLPFWATLFVTNELIRTGGPLFWAIEIPVVVVFVVLAIYLYRNLTLENATTKKWVARLIRGTGWTSVSRAMEFLREIEEFRKDSGSTSTPTGSSSAV
jgi:hypothetical protein